MKKRNKPHIFFYIFLMIFLVSCSSEIIITEYIQNDSCPPPTENTIEVNRTVYINNTVYIQNRSEFNYTSNETTNYVIGLIRRIKRCETLQNRYMNVTECEWELERLNKSLIDCNNSLNKIKEALD